MEVDWLLSYTVVFALFASSDSVPELSHRRLKSSFNYLPRSISPRLIASLPSAPPLTTAIIMGSDPQYIKYPDLSLAQHIFDLQNPHSKAPSRQNALPKLQEAISEHKMAPLYRFLAHPVEGILNSPGEGASGSRPSTSNSRAINGMARLSGAPDVQFPWDEALYERLKNENKEELETFQKEEDEAAEKAGDTEIQAARGRRAEFFARIGDKVGSHEEMFHRRLQL